eukprot:scaffold279603_cov16-Tisochrysis_lutea.AAC.1
MITGAAKAASLWAAASFQLLPHGVPGAQLGCLQSNHTRRITNEHEYRRSPVATKSHTRQHSTPHFT